MEHTLRERIGHFIVQANLDVIEHRQPGKQADVLEGARHAQLANLVRLFANQVLAVQPDTAVGRAVHAGQHIERRGLARAVRADEADQPAFFDLHAQVVHGA